MGNKVSGAVLMQYFCVVMDKSVYFLDIDAFKITSDVLTHSPQCCCIA